MPWPDRIPQEHVRMINETFARVKIDTLLAAQSWDVPVTQVGTLP